VRIREKAINWDMEITEARRTLNWEKQLSLAINPEEAERIHSRRDRQITGNDMPCTMCGASCVYLMQPQQKKEHRDSAANIELMKNMTKVTYSNELKLHPNS
jgi:phosphomethylpyrimidine synthase